MIEFDGHKIFVIDTNYYAGNFERESCAYITGIIGECEVGDDYAKEYTESVDFEKITEQVADEHGCCRPVSIYPSFSGEYNSIAIFFTELPEDNIISLLKRRALEISKKLDYEILGFRWIELKIVTKEREI